MSYVSLSILFSLYRLVGIVAFMLLLNKWNTVRFVSKKVLQSTLYSYSI